MIGLYLAASGAAATLSALSSVADNIANLGTPGFKRMLNSAEAASGNGTPYQFALPPSAPVIDTSQGPIQATNNPMDVAITGSGFITVQGPNGAAYTRNGSLAVQSDGTLTAAGYPVLNTSGGTISIKSPGSIVIGGDGTISVNGQRIGRIGIADSTGVKMVSLGASLYRGANGEELPPATSSQMHQGFLEGATGSEMGELTSLLSMMRNYESSMKAVQNIDNSQGQVIQAFTLQA
ncbi:MAG TPA: flagellar hook-basal body complex protein [Candidatus Binataceae bacterium]|nr:flagellar hook-basal body complex protein [Candidatus Binataceae bacterium]